MTYENTTTALWPSSETLAVILRTLRVTHAARIENRVFHAAQRSRELLMVNPWNADGEPVELESSNSLALLYVEINLPVAYDHMVRVWTQAPNIVVSLAVQSLDPLSIHTVRNLEPPIAATHFFNRPLER
jgi:hypothetical protein